MLVFAAITPHPPILIPTIGQDSLEQIKKTKEAMENLGQEIYAARPDTVIVISPHGELMSEAFTINTAPQFKASFKKFGDLETQLECQGDAALAYQIKEALETKVQLQMIAEAELDHGTSVPLFYLLTHLPQTKVIILGYSGMDLKAHWNFGKMLMEVIHNTNKRVAVIASGDLSHALTKDAPAGYVPEGKKFDKELIDFLNNKNTDKIINFDVHLVEAAAECGLKSILILLGILGEQNYSPKQLSYQGPFGVGYLVMEFELDR